MFKRLAVKWGSQERVIPAGGGGGDIRGGDVREHLTVIQKQAWVMFSCHPVLPPPSRSGVMFLRHPPRWDARQKQSREDCNQQSNSARLWFNVEPTSATLAQHWTRVGQGLLCSAQECDRERIKKGIQISGRFNLWPRRFTLSPFFHNYCKLFPGKSGTFLEYLHELDQICLQWSCPIRGWEWIFKTFQNIHLMVSYQKTHTKINRQTYPDKSTKWH